MGSAQSSYVTPETALTALVVVGAVALGYNHIPLSPKDATAPAAPAPAAPGTAPQKKGKKVKGKGKASDAEAAPAPAAPVDGAAPPAASVAASGGSLPGQFDADTAAAPASGAPKKPKKKGKKAASATGTPGGETPALAQSVSASIDFLNASEIQLAAPTSADDGAGAGKQKKKKGKGKAATPSAASPSTSQTLAPAPQAASAKDDKPKPKQTKDSKTSKAQPVSGSSALSGPTASTTSLDTDGSWTRVGAPRRGKGAASAEASAAEQTTPSGTGTSSPVVDRSGADDASVEEDEEEDDDEEAKPGEEREFLLSAAARATGETRKTLAERLVPKPRKTHVEDMLETPDYPTLARVVRVRPRPDEKPAHGFTWGDYEDVRTGDDADAEGDGGRRSAAENEDGDDDEGWGVVTGRRSKRLPSGTAATPAHKATKAPESLTKKQRQNRARQEDGKAARDAAEAERLAALERHKRQLESERIKAQFAAGEGKGKKGKESGGMVASVDEKGRLVWE